MKQIIYVIVSNRGFLHNFEGDQDRSMCWWSEDFLKAKLFPNSELCEKFKAQNSIKGDVLGIPIKLPWTKLHKHGKRY